MWHRRILATLNAGGIIFPSTKPATLSCTDWLTDWLWHPLRCHYCERDWISGQVPHVMYTHCAHSDGGGISMNVAFQTDEIPANLLYCPSVIFQKPNLSLSLFLFCSLANIFSSHWLSLLFFHFPICLVMVRAGTIPGWGCYLGWVDVQHVNSLILFLRSFRSAPSGVHDKVNLRFLLHFMN
jgi:hypothetical protein